jgi:hypothetical protein
MNFLLTKILWLRRSKWQFLMAGLAFMLGLSIMLTALEAYLKVEKVLDAQKSQGQFLILNKKISLVNTLGLASSTFSKEEMGKIRANPVFKGVGFIQSNQFQASIRAKSYINFYTMAFFESVSPGFLDVENPEFRWRQGSRDLPIIVSQDFLNLYNFGFALSQGLPQVSRDMIKQVTFDVEIDGPGGKEVFTGRIVGFTERIASILVPMSFMEWSNREIAQKQAALPSRLIVKVESMSDPALTTYLEKNRLVTDQERLKLGKTGSVLNTVMKSLAILGTIFISLALIMFAMNFKLILAEASTDIRLLIELGYRHTRIGLNLLSYFAAFVLILFLVCSYILFQTNDLITETLQGQGLDMELAGGPGKSLLAGAFFSISIVFINGALIIRQLRQIA